MKLTDPAVMERAKELAAACGCRNDSYHAGVARAQTEIFEEKARGEA